MNIKVSLRTILPRKPRMHSTHGSSLLFYKSVQIPGCRVEGSRVLRKIKAVILVSLGFQKVVGSGLGGILAKYNDLILCRTLLNITCVSANVWVL